MRGGPTCGAHHTSLAMTMTTIRWPMLTMLTRRRAARTAALSAMMTVRRWAQQQRTAIGALRAKRTERCRLRVESLPATRVLCAFARKVARLVAARGAAGSCTGAIWRPCAVLIVLPEPVGYIEALQRGLDAQLMLAQGGWIVIMRFL